MAYLVSLWGSGESTTLWNSNLEKLQRAFKNGIHLKQIKNKLQVTEQKQINIQ